MRPVQITFLLAATLVSWSANGNFFSGKELYDVCAASRQEYDKRSQCIGYVTAVFDSIEMYQQPASSGICVSRPTTIKDLTDAVVKYLTQHADSQSKPAANGVRAALMESFPCPKSN